MSSERERALVPVLLSLTAVTGLVDAASVLGLGRVFTANMTGNVVPGLSEPAPTPTPTPPPPAAGLLSHPQLVACLGAAQEIRIFRHSGGA